MSRAQPSDVGRVMQIVIDLVTLLVIDLVTIWLLAGVLCNILAAPRRVRFLARVIVLFAGPVMLFFEGTPTMAAFIRWAER